MLMISCSPSVSSKLRRRCSSRHVSPRCMRRYDALVIFRVSTLWFGREGLRMSTPLLWEASIHVVSMKSPGCIFCRVVEMGFLVCLGDLFSFAFNVFMSFFAVF